MAKEAAVLKNALISLQFMKYEDEDMQACSHAADDLERTAVTLGLVCGDELLHAFGAFRDDCSRYFNRNSKGRYRGIFNTKTQPRSSIF